MHRFFLLRWTPADAAARAQAQAIAARLSANGAWRRLFDRRGALASVVEDPTDHPLTVFEDDRGFVVGVLFQGQARAACGRAVLDGWTASGGRTLIEEFWGGYVAVIADRAGDALYVVRDPTGARSCFLAALGSVRCVFSDLSDYVAAGGQVSVNCARIAGFLAHPRLSIAETALGGIEELLPGERLSLERDGERRDMVWRPPAAAHDLSFAEAAAVLRRSVLAVTGTWAQVRPKILHRLSGGLDSAIVLSCLLQAREAAAITCINEYSLVAPEGDERQRARLCAEPAGVALLEVEMRPEAVALARIIDAPLAPTPALADLSFADQSFAGAARHWDGALLTSGQAGDHLFHRSRTAFIAADAARAGVLTAEAAMDVARLCGISVWRAAMVGLGSGWLRQPYPLATHFSAPPLLADGASAHAFAQQRRHPWLDNWRQAPPGQMLRVLQLMEAPHYHAPSAFNRSYLPAPVLLSQPLIETVFAIPSFIMTAGGGERALARAAFAGDIPEAVALATAKGDTTRHFVAVLRGNWKALGAALLGGALRDLAILNVPAIEAVLRSPDTLGLEAATFLLRCFIAEMWLRKLAH